MKDWLASKTVWVNTLTLLVAALTYLAGVEWMPRETVAILTGLALPIVNLILRWLTDTPIRSVLPGMDKFRPRIVKRADRRIELETKASLYDELAD